MLKEPYTAKSYSYNSKYIKNALALRPPQADSLEIFARLCDVLSLKKDADLNQELAAVRALCPTLTSFERDFPSICFALATGIGKTRLMGACIENAKAKGAAVGRPRTTADQIPATFLKFYPAYKNRKLTATEFARVAGIGRTTLYKYLKIVESR